MNARRLTAVLAISIAFGAATNAASGYWTGFQGALQGIGAGAAATVNQGAAPTAVSHGTRVVVSWGTSTASNGEPVDGYVVKRYDAASGGPAQTISSDCAGRIAANTCTELSLPAGDWKYTVTPVLAGNWRGQESELSGVAQTGPVGLELDRSVIGPPLPTEITGTLTGFVPGEGISYEIDGAPLSGTPSSVGAGGGASIRVTIPAPITDGSHTIAVVGDHPGDPSLAEASILVDTTAPTINAFTTPAANAAGWNNTSPIEVNGTVDDGNGSGISYVKYTDDGSDPRTSPTAIFAVTPPSVTESTTFKFYGVDLAGNESLVDTLEVKIDATLPYFTVALADVHGAAFITAASPQGVPGKAYYRGVEAGSFRFRVTPIPLGGSPTVSAGFTPLSADTAGFTFDSSSITAPPGGPYDSNPLSWAAGSSSTPSGTITVLDAAGNSFGDAGSITDDSTGPEGGSVDASGLTGTGGRYSRSLELSLELAPGTDAGVGLADGSAPTDAPARLLRASATLSGGNCGTYGSYAQVAGNNPNSTVRDTVPSDDTCYRYRYLVPDHLSNLATYESPDIKVVTSASAALRPTDATITPVSGIAAQSVSGSTVYYNPALLGSFNVDSSASAPFAGVAHMDFPGLGGFTGGGAETTPTSGNSYRTTYAWSDNLASPSPGPQRISATGNAGNTATNDTAFSVVRDDTAPGGGSADATGLGGTANRYSTSTTLSIALSPGTDAGSGLATGGRQLLRASASLSSDGTSDGSCGAFGAYTQVGADNPPSPIPDTVPVDRTCYSYRYVVTDRVGNQVGYTSPNIKVDAAPPPAPALSFSNLSNASWSGSGTAVFYRPAAANGGFTVNASSVDTTSGTTAYGFPTLPAGWSSSSAGSGIQSYSWSSPNPTAPSGNQTVTANNNAGGQSSSSFTATVTADATAPSGGSVSYTNGYSTNATVAVSFTKGTDTGSGVNAASGLLQRSSATLANGTCGSFGAFTTVATNPTSSHSNAVTTGCYQYRYLISDNVGNQATYASASVVKVDQLPPSNTISITAVTGGAFSAFAGATLYYKGDVAGSFKYVDALADAESGPASVDFPEIAASGWTHAAETVSTPAGGPYVSSTFSWTANPANPTLKNLIGRDAAGKVWGAAVSFYNDSVAPVNSAVNSPNGIVNTASVPVSVYNGTDPGAGIDLTSLVLKRDVAPLDTATETCGSFAGTYATTVTLVGGFDTTASSGNCYRYRYTVSDKVGNAATVTSASVTKFDTSGPRVTSITSLQANSSPGDGRLQVGDRLVLTFNQSLANATVPTSFSGATETSAGPMIPVTLTVPGITNGPRDTGSALYLLLPSTTATFGGNIALSNNGTSTTVTVAVTSVSGAATAASNGALSFAPAATILDGGGNSAAGTFTTPVPFKLF